MSIHAFKIVKGNLEIDVPEILKYPVLAHIYNRDNSIAKEYAYKEFMYCVHLSDRRGYVFKAGLSKAEAKQWAKDRTGLLPSWKPDEYIEKAIALMNNSLNITVVEDLLDGSIRSLHLSSKLIKRFADEIDEIVNDPNSTRDDLLACEDTLKDLIKRSHDIPQQIDILEDLKEQYDKQQGGVAKVRGGGIYKRSYDGDDEETLGSNSSIQEVD